MHRNGGWKCFGSVRCHGETHSALTTTQQLSATMKPNHGLKSKCQGIPFRMFTIMFVGFVIQLSVNSITLANSLGLAGIH